MRQRLVSVRKGHYALVGKGSARPLARTEQRRFPSSLSVMVGWSASLDSLEGAKRQHTDSGEG